MFRLAIYQTLKIPIQYIPHPAYLALVVVGLESHPQHEVAKKQMSGFGGMVTFLVNGSLETAEKFFKHIKVEILLQFLYSLDSCTCIIRDHESPICGGNASVLNYALFLFIPQ